MSSYRDSQICGSGASAATITASRIGLERSPRGRNPAARGFRFGGVHDVYAVLLHTLTPFVKGYVVAGILWAVISILFVFWILGFALHIGGGLIHLLLVVAAVLFVFNLLTGRGARV